jgi:hypothetical protein
MLFIIIESLLYKRRGLINPPFVKGVTGGFLDWRAVLDFFER